MMKVYLPNGTPVEFAEANGYSLDNSLLTIWKVDQARNDYRRVGFFAMGGWAGVTTNDPDVTEVTDPRVIGFGLPAQ